MVHYSSALKVQCTESNQLVNKCLHLLIPHPEGSMLACSQAMEECMDRSRVRVLTCMGGMLMER